MNETNYAIRLCLIGLCIFTALCGGCVATLNYQDTVAIAKLVEMGSAPQDAACAIRSSKEREGTCVIISARKGERNAD